MRILDLDTDQGIDKVTVYLTTEEAQELRDSINALLREPHAHHHVPSADFRKELTVCLYDPTRIDEFPFDERSRRLIREDQ